MSPRRAHVERTVIALVAVAALAVPAAGCGRSDPPRLEVSAAAGSGPATGGDVRVRYEVRNGGGRPLALDGVAPACGCRLATTLPERLAPDAATALDVTCRAPERAGETVRELRLRTDDPANPVTTLRVALQSAVAAPAPIYFGYVAVGESATRDVILPASVALDALAPSPRAELTVEALPARSDGALGARVRFTPRLPGVVRATVDLGAGHALPVTAVGYADVLAFPAEIPSPAASGSASLPSITLMGAGPGPLVIARIDYPAGVSGDLKVIEAGKRYRLALRGRASAGEIRVHGAGGGAPLLVIPVAGLPSSSRAGAAAAPAA